MKTSFRKKSFWWTCLVTYLIDCDKLCENINWALLIPCTTTRPVTTHSINKVIGVMIPVVRALPSVHFVVDTAGNRAIEFKWISNEISSALTCCALREFSILWFATSGSQQRRLLTGTQASILWSVLVLDKFHTWQKHLRLMSHEVLIRRHKLNCTMMKPVDDKASRVKCRWIWVLIELRLSVDFLEWHASGWTNLSWVKSTEIAGNFRDEKTLRQQNSRAGKIKKKS